MTGKWPSWTQIRLPNPLEEIQISEELIKQTQREMLAYVTRQEAEAYMTGRFPEDPIKLRVDPPEQDRRTLRISYDISERELYLEARKHDILDKAIDACASMLAQEITNRVFRGDFDKIMENAIAEAVKKEVREQVKQAVADKIEDFIDEVL